MARTKKNLKSKAVGYIRRMIENVLGNPTTLDQNSWPEPEEGGACTTPFCAAGHIIHAKSPELFDRLCKIEAASKDSFTKPGVDWPKEANKVLGLDKSDLRTWHLFGSVGSWPIPYKKMYMAAIDKRGAKRRANGYAKAFAAFWEAVIATDGLILDDITLYD